MNWQSSVLIIIALYSLVCFYKGFRSTYYKKNPYGLTPWFNILGAFVWADAAVFGVFFLGAAIVSLVLNSVLIFLLIFSVFWVIRSVGEQIYWFLEQFAVKHRNEPKTLTLHKYFPGDSIWVYYQIFWQCISVIAIISSVYFFVQILK